MKRFGFILLALHLLGSIAAAAEGINLSWDDCGSAGVSFKTFACDDNAGTPDIFVASFSPPPGVDRFGGLAASIDINAGDDNGILVDWWKHRGTPGNGVACRDTNGLDIDVNFGSACLNPFTSRPIDGAGYLYNTEYRPETARMDITVGYNGFGEYPALPPGPEYYAFRILVTRYRSAGGDSCAGCSVAACIVLNLLQVFDNLDLVDPIITSPLDRNYITWQATLQNCPLSTPVRKSTWGRIKTLYH